MVQRYYLSNLPTTSGRSIHEVIIDTNNNGIVFSDIGNYINPTKSAFYVIEVSTYNAVSYITAKGATSEINPKPLLYHGVQVNEAWSGWHVL